MTEEKKKKEALILKQKERSLQEKKAFDDHLNKIKLDPSEEKKIKKEALKEIIKDETLGSFILGKIPKMILDWNKDYKKGVRAKKEEILLMIYFSKTRENKDSIKRIKDFLTNPFGNVIFNKILRIIDNTPPDKELLNHLSNVLKKVVESKDFGNLFGKHKFVLSQIEKLSPQALTILSDYRNWPHFKMKSFSALSGRIESDWLLAFITPYAEQKGIPVGGEERVRIMGALNELKQFGFIEAHLVKGEIDVAVGTIIQEGQKEIEVIRTRVGIEITEYLDV